MKRRKSNPPSRPAAPPPSRPPRFPVWKKLLFAAAACVLFFAALELVLAVAGVKPTLFERDPYVGFSSRIPLFVRDAGSGNPDALVTAPNKRHIFNLQRFNARKPANTIRIFCVGGSTTYGHPYEDPMSFAGWLRAMLPKADPSRNWEVINCGGISYATYRESLLMEELVRYQPDLFIVLTGQNEFLERRTYGDILSMPAPLRSTGALLSRTRVHAAMKGIVEKLGAKTSAPGLSSNLMPAEVETLLERVVGPQAYHRDETLQKQAVAHFRFNLARMVDIAESAGAKMVFINPASNLRSCAPFKSEHRAGLAASDLARWQSHLQRAKQLATASRLADALSAVDEAAAMDDRHAELHYLRGHLLWQLQRHAEAKAAFMRARDEDVCPLRALTPMFGAMAEVASARHVPLVDFERLLESRSLNGIPGDDWFLDHVHPTIEGNRLLALALLDTLAKGRLVRLAPSWNEAAALEVKRAVESTLTPQTHGTALLMLAKVLAWAGKHAEAYAVSQRAIALAASDPAIHYEAGKNASYLNRDDEALKHLQKALELRPEFVEARTLLGNLMGRRGDVDEALRQCRAALAQRPDDPQLHSNLGTLLRQQGRLYDAVASLREAIRLAPNYAEAHSNLAWMLKEQGDFDGALAGFREAVRLKPGLPSPTIGLAWMLATHPNPARRDPAEAVKIAERLVVQSDYKSWMSLDALAAAHAATGKFEEAVSAAQRALPLVRAASPTEAAAVEARLKLYESRQAFVETPVSR